MTSAPERLSASLADRYRIERELGAGGMATVYLAEDLKHHRKVAIKVLRPELAAVIGAERFLREIQTIANLQHPHILGLIDSGEVQGTAYYVMPYVEGESLRDRLNREKQLPITDAVRIASEVAGALDYAHRRGVIHRDIKPENILLHDDQALVADFGIALAISTAAGATRLTETGMSLGTPQYMSPEQAMGERAITARSDVYALGALTYEMLVGEPPFSGPTAQGIVAKVMTESPRPLRLSRHTVPAPLESAVMRALEKLPADRFATAAAFAAALKSSDSDAIERAGDRHGERARAPIDTSHAGRQRASRATVATVMLGVLAAASLAALVVVALRRDRGHMIRSARFTVPLPAGERLFDGEPAVVLSPDGSRLLLLTDHAGQRHLLLRQLDRLGTAVIAGSEDASGPCISPDGNWIAFSQHGKLVKIPMTGGTPTALADAEWGGGAWGPNDWIVYTPSYQAGLWRVPANGGRSEKLTTPDAAKGELGHWWPQFLPDGRHVLFTDYVTPASKSRIEVLDLDTGRRTVVAEGTFGRYAAGGRLVYAQDGTLFSVPFDPDRLRTKGPAVPVLEHVGMNSSAGIAAYAVAHEEFAYATTDPTANQTRPEWVTRTGAVTPLALAPGLYANPAIAPDRGSIAFTASLPDQAGRDVWVYDIGRSVLTRLTFEQNSGFGPVWSRDGRQIFFNSEQPAFDIHVHDAEGEAPARAVVTGRDDKFVQSVSADGRLLAFLVNRPGTQELATVVLDTPSIIRRYVTGRPHAGHAAFSPDGRWMAYDADESGRTEIYLQSSPDPGRRKVQLSTGGGAEPLWTRSGHEVVYRNGDSVFAVAVDPAAGVAGRPAFLFAGQFPPVWFPRSYDVTPDGERFLMVAEPPGLAMRAVTVVLGWNGGREGYGDGGAAH